MTHYKTYKTTMGRKYRVHMSDQEVIDRTLYRIALVAMPLISSMVMFWLWVKMG